MPAGQPITHRLRRAARLVPDDLVAQETTPSACSASARCHGIPSRLLRGRPRWCSPVGRSPRPVPAAGRAGVCVPGVGVADVDPQHAVAAQHPRDLPEDADERAHVRLRVRLPPELPVPTVVVVEVEVRRTGHRRLQGM